METGIRQPRQESLEKSVLVQKGGRRVNMCAPQHTSLSPSRHEVETQRSKTLSSWGQEEPSGAPVEWLKVDARVTALVSLANLQLVRLWEYKETVAHLSHT